MTYAYATVVANCEHERLHPSAYVQQGGLCQRFARTMVGSAAWAGSALQAWLATPAIHRFGPDRVRPGMIGYADYPDKVGEAGHAYVIVENGYCYSTDILGEGRVWKVPISTIHTKWGMRILGGIDATPPAGALHLAPIHVAALPKVDLSMIQAAAKVDPTKPQGYATYKAGTALVEKALVKLGYLNAKWSDGSFGSKTREAYVLWQKAIKSSYRDGIPRQTDLVALGKKVNMWTVVA